MSGVPADWSATLLGGGQPVAAAMPATDANVALQLRLDIPAGAGTGSPTLTVNAEGKDARVELPITVTLAKELPAKLKLNAALPALRGSAKSSFDYQLSVKNDSGRDLIVSFVANAPRHFEFLAPDQLHMNDWSYDCLARLLGNAIIEAVIRPQLTAGTSLQSQVRPIP